MFGGCLWSAGLSYGSSHDLLHHQPEIEVFILFLQTQIVHLEDAYGQLDAAVAAAMRNSKPVYISICCNLAGSAHPSFAGKLLLPCKDSWHAA